MKKLAGILIVVIMAYSCKKPYTPVAITSNGSYLVVEGLINIGLDSTYIKLTRTVKLSGPDTVKAELNAAVTVEGSDNTAYPLQEAGNGMYSAPSLGLSTAIKYRLRIITSDNLSYLSDFVEAKDTPDIDSLSYKIENNGVQFYATTHDPKNNTRYYRWDFDETFGYLSFYQSYFEIGSDGLPEYRVAQNDKIYECFKTEHSNQVLLGSSAKLAQDVVINQPLDFISGSSGKISHGYSLLVRQYALTSGGFAYWQNLKKNTEQLGSIFDAQPSEIQGNIHCITNPSQPVVGFISASGVKAKRLFLDAQTTSVFVPNYLPPPTSDECTANTIQVAPQESFATRLYNLTYKGDTVLITGITNPFTEQIVAYTYASKECVDCRAKVPYGTNMVPVFWPTNEHY